MMECLFHLILGTKAFMIINFEKEIIIMKLAMVMVIMAIIVAIMDIRDIMGTMDIMGIINIKAIEVVKMDIMEAAIVIATTIIIVAFLRLGMQQTQNLI